MPPKHFLVPDYLLKFKCSSCTECCKRWKIIIDKQTVEKYEELAVNDEEMAAMLAAGLKKDKKGRATVMLRDTVKKLIVEQSDGKQGEVVSVDTAVCPFLADDGLCAIQKKYGIDFLSDTCKIFPRNVFLTDRGYEMGLSYACATAASTLKEKNPVEFYQDPEGIDFLNLNEQFGKIGSLVDMKKAGKGNYFDVEEMLIDIIQIREMDIDTRLILMGIVVDKLKDGDIAGIRKYLQHLDEEMIKQLKLIPSQATFMMKLIKEAVDKRLLQGGITEKEMNRFLVLVYGQLKLLDEATIPDVKVQKLLDGYNRYYRPYTNNISHILENYFVNFIFSKKFYTYKYMDAFFLMLFFYILIRFFTIAACMAEETTANENIMINVIIAIERSVGHNTTYYQDVLRLVKEGDYHRLPYVVSLINL